MTATEPGWYRDPSDDRHHRYWDGEQWLSECEQLRRQGQARHCPEGDAPVRALG